MLFTVYLAIALAALGFFLAGLVVFKIPHPATSQAVLSLSRAQAPKAAFIGRLSLSLAVKLAPYIPMTKYKERRMETLLRAVEIKRTPRVYVAQALMKAAAIAIVLLPAWMFSFPVYLAGLALAVLVFFREMDQPAALLNEKREKIEAAAPRLVGDIAQQLKSNRDIVMILESFANNETDTLSRELAVTVADIKSSSLEPALRRFESRIHSSMLSELVRGLLAVNRGEAGAEYFAMLAHDFKVLELQRLKVVAAKRPERVGLYNFLLVGCFIAIALVALVTDVFQNITTMF